MRLDFIGKARGKLFVHNQKLKKGQKELVPAIKITIETDQPNTILDKLDASLRAIYFCKAGSPAKQGALDVAPAMSDLPDLTDAGVKLGDQHWADEQTGCTFIVHQGVTGDQTVRLKDSTVSNVRWKNNAGGSVRLRLDIYASDVDRDTVGDLGILHKNEVEFELVLPKLLQRDIEDGAGAGGGSALNPIAALRGAERKARRDAAVGAGA